MDASSGSRGNRILFVQWMGDYREAYDRLKTGGPETFYAQRYSLEKVAELSSRCEQVGLLCCCGDRAYDDVLDNGVRSMNVGLAAGTKDFRPVLDRIQEFRPTHVIFTTPLEPAIRRGLDHGVEVLPLLADSFVLNAEGLSPLRKLARIARQLYRFRRLAALLNDRRIRYVSNHHISPCENLARLGVDRSKLVPWNWPAMVQPDSYPVKSGPGDWDRWELCFVGAIVDTKGVGVAIEAVGILRDRRRDVRLRILGGGEIERFTALAREKGVADSVVFEGRRGHDEVLEAMAASHLVLVLSFHSYAEGLPMVIQESMATRTPMVCSDHPMFRGRVRPEVAEIVPERRPDAVADAVERVLTQPDRYRAMSEATRANFEELQAPPRWHEVFYRWLDNTPESNRWLADHSLASGAYDADRRAVASRPSPPVSEMRAH